MNSRFDEQNENDLNFSEVEEALDDFFATFDFKPYLVHETLYYFEEEVFEEIIAALRNCRLPKHHITYKDVLREKISQKLELTHQDLILCMDGVVYVKRFFNVDMSGDGPERRACGLSHDVLVEYTQRFFPQDAHKEKIFTLLPHLVEDILNFRKITPVKFKKLFIPMFINMVEIIVIEQSDLEDLKSIRGLSLYLLRDIFDGLMLFIAGDILFHFSNADRKAIEFLSFFSVHESIDSKGNRHKANPILDDSNHAWNITTIRSTMIQHKKAKQAVYDKKNSLITIKNKLDTYKLDQKEYAIQKAKAQEEWQGIEEIIQGIHKTLHKLQESDSEEVRFVEDGEEKIFQRKLLMAKMFKKEDKLITEKTKLQKTFDEINMKISNKQKDIDTWEKKYAENQDVLAAFESKGHPMDKQYERIQRALAKTLASR